MITTSQFEIQFNQAFMDLGDEPNLISLQYAWINIMYVHINGKL